MAALTARPTTYNGIPMRSRLEARVAADLDGQGLSWRYEPRAYASSAGQYLPDFEIVTSKRFLVFLEVRPTIERALAATSRMQIILASEPAAALAVLVPEDGVMLLSTWSDRTWRVVRNVLVAR